MPELINLESKEIKRAAKGGRREGAGRKPMQPIERERWLRARGINPLHASEILAHVVDERRLWQRVMASKDERVVLQALMFLVKMRDGAPAQQINLTSQSITVSVDDIEKARAIVREMTAPMAVEACANGARDGLMTADTGDHGDESGSKSIDLLEIKRSEAPPLMLSSDEGERGGG